MNDLSTKYLGLDLKNPIIVGSCGLTNSLTKIKELADNQAGAIVLKSLFEEQIQAEYSANLKSYTADYPGASDYIREYTRGNEVEAYLKLIAEAKKAVQIPIIASINCVSANEWVSFAKAVEQEGADAIERLLVSFHAGRAEIGGVADLAIIDEQRGELIGIVHVERVAVLEHHPFDRLLLDQLFDIAHLLVGHGCFSGFRYWG